MKKIIGKWNKNKYVVLNKIGEGGIGIVYKVKDYMGKIKAIKISQNFSSLTKEYYIMKELKTIESIPEVYDIDDFYINGDIYHFIVMDFIDGENIKYIIKYKSINLEQTLGIGIILTDLLQRIYELGYIYADLKLENTIIDFSNKKIYFVDFGGVIKKGDYIKEYTPCYNINSWFSTVDNNQIESMTFSITMILICIIFGKEFNPLIYNIEYIFSIINKLNIDKSVKKFLINGIKGKYICFRKYKSDMIKLLPKCDSFDRKYNMDKIDYILFGSIAFFVFSLIFSLKNCTF